MIFSSHQNIPALKKLAIFGPVQPEWPGSDMEKIASIQTLLADDFLEDCGHFGISNNFWQCLYIDGHNSPTLIHNQPILV